MQRICWTLRVKPEYIEEYKELHRDVWPEMQEALRRTGWHNYSIFLRDDGLLIGYLETEDWQAALDGMAELDVNKLWQENGAYLFDELGDLKADESMMPIPEVFHLD